MTPLPKKRHAKARSRTRRAAAKLSIPNLVKCPNCQSLRHPHRACTKCGYYKGSAKGPAEASQKA